LVITNSSPNTSPNPTTGAAPAPSSGGGPSAALIGGIAGALVALLLVVAAFYAGRRSNLKKGEEGAGELAAGGEGQAIDVTCTALGPEGAAAAAAAIPGAAPAAAPAQIMRIGEVTAA
jgi:hypothetical protein